MLISIILERLPNTIKLQISRKLGKGNWNIEQFLLFMHEETSARENFEYLKQNDFDKKELNNQFTTSSLHAQPEDHYSHPCEIVTVVNSRREILTKGKSFFFFFFSIITIYNWKQKINQKHTTVPQYQCYVMLGGN